MFKIFKNSLTLLGLALSASSLYASASIEDDDVSSDLAVVTRMTQDLSLISDDHRFKRHHKNYDIKVKKEDLEDLKGLFASYSGVFDVIYHACLEHQHKKSRAASMKPGQVEKLKQNFVHFVGMMGLLYNEELTAYGQAHGSYNALTDVMKKMDQEPLRQRYVLPYQRLCNGVIDILQAAKAIPSGLAYGQIAPVSSDFGVFYYQNQTGYVAQAYSTKGPQAIGDYFGGLMNGLHQHMFIFEDGEQIKDWGLAISFSSSRVPGFNNDVRIVPVRGYNADLPFTAGRLSKRIVYNTVDDFNDTHFSRAFLMAFGEEAILEKRSGFFSFPTQQQDAAIVELLFLESLIEESKSDDPVRSFKAIQYIKAVEEEVQAPIQSHIESIHEEVVSLIEEELTAAAVSVPSSSSVGQESRPVETRKRGKQMRGRTAKRSTAKQQVAQSQSSAASSSTTSARASGASESSVKRAKAEALFEEVKAKSRVRYRDYLRVIQNIIKKFPDEVVEKSISHVSVRGSHFNFHSETGKGLTLVKKHGSKDDTLPPSRVNNFSQNLIHVLINAMPEDQIQTLQ